MDPVMYAAAHLALQRQADLLRNVPPRHGRERKQRRVAFTLRRTKPVLVPARCATC